MAGTAAQTSEKDVPEWLRPFHDEAACGLCADLPHSRWTHDRETGATWDRNSKTAQCPTCGELFSTPSGFDKHLLSVGCRNPAEVTTKKGVRVFADPTPNAAGWPVWHQAGSFA